MNDVTPIRPGVTGGNVVVTHTGTVTGGTSLTVQEPIAVRIRNLQREARTMAREHVEMLRASLAETARLAAEIADGGEAYPVGARELSRRLQEEAAAQAMTLMAINDRANG